jgi:hypothetical protein
MRGKKVKAMRKEAPPAPNPKRVVGRIVIEAYADGRVGIKSMPATERMTRDMMSLAARRMNDYFEQKAKTILSAGPKKNA